LAEQREANGDGREEEPGKSILHLCLFKDGSVSTKLFSSINCKCITLVPVSCSSVLSVMSLQNSLIQKRNYENKTISNHHSSKEDNKELHFRKSIDKGNYAIKLSQSSLHAYSNYLQLRIFHQHGIKTWIKM